MAIINEGLEEEKEDDMKPHERKPPSKSKIGVDEFL